jgi:Starch-binding associating with outer membrane
MKKITKVLLLGAIFLATMSSCNDYLNINADPSVPQKTDAINILPPVFAQMVNGEASDTRFVGRYIQNFSVNATAGTDVYERHGWPAGSDNTGQKWRSHYWSIGLNIDLITEDAKPKENWDIVGAAQAIRAWSWQSCTDYHGEMIFKQAWEPNRYTFEFDPQEDIYAEVIRLSTEALANLDRKDGKPRLALGDLVYKGDVEKWKRFVYANLARNANHLSNKSTYKPDDVIKYCDLSLTSNADNFAVPHINTSAVDANYFGTKRGNIGAYRPTTTIIKLLDGTTFGGVRDPRLPIMFAPCPDTVWRGITTLSTDPNNTAGNTKRIPNLFGNIVDGVNDYSGTGRWIFADAAPHYLVTYAEILFMKAEAQFRKKDPAALATFKAAIGAHMDFCGVSAANKTAYLASAAIPQAVADLKMSDIMQQKYIALYFHGAIETFMDMRRFRYDPTVYTTFVQLVGSQFYPDNGGKYCFRVRPRYNSEYVWNRASLDKIGGNNIDYHTYETWNIKP